jgi:signal transduction histidine kinase
MGGKPASRMLVQKLLTTLYWAAACIAVAMVADYCVTILLLGNPAGYTPLITLLIATLVSFPSTFLLVSSKYDLRNARDELAAARDHALEANRSKTVFFANMSHELRTPLNAIIGFSQLLKTDIFAPKRVEYAQLIHGSAEHLLTLVNDLLDVSTIEAGKVEIHDTEVLLTSLLDECCNICEPRLRAAQLRLVRNIPADLPAVMGDMRALKQIVLNLLTNAIKFSQPEAVVEVFGSVLPSGALEFGVRDEGIGIAPEDQALVFERYGRAEHQHSQGQEGTGLGLPIVRGLVEAHGGAVSLVSELGVGTCVTVRLPENRAVHQSVRSLVASGAA